jgi:GTPase SAR1 family protein
LNSAAVKFTCSKADCTASATGTCLLGKPSPEECEYYVPIPSDSLAEKIASIEGPARTFHAGIELGTIDTLQVSSGSYTHFIGLMGPYNAGKTCFLLSLYLLASRQLLPDGFFFRRSLTLQGFEDRARKLREWKGGALPQQLADHTNLADDRRPGFLHLGLVKKDEQFDLMLSDLPGEWTTSLIKRAETAIRWDFLKRADGIIIFLDGTELVGRDRINHVIRAKQLLHRLKDTLQIAVDLPLVLLVSKADELEMKQPELVNEITQYASEMGFNPRLILCASFSRNPELVPNGAGVVAALEHILAQSQPESPINWSHLKSEQLDEQFQTPFRMFKALIGGVFL